jgi:MoxR-like ATPase
MPSRIARRLTDAASRIILGKEHAVRLALACILARGHLLIEDIPGVGKTTLAHVLARLLGLQFQRIQFTSDMLPADIIGVSIFDQRDASFRFHPGPVFAQLLLADEINRATPKAQSALLEAMEERQISAEGQTWPLPEPFFVIATQNPADQIGTFPLPESQLDRFLMRISLGYPDRAAERALLAGEDRREMLARLPPSSSRRTGQPLRRRPAVHVGPRLLDYVQALLEHSREAPASPSACRPAGLGLLGGAGLGAAGGRDHVLPEDVQAVLPAVAGHRLRATGDTPLGPDALARRLVEAVP